MDLIIDRALQEKCFRIARRMVTSPDDAEDVCGEAYLVALSAVKHGQFREDADLNWEGFILRILRRLAANVISNRRGQEATLPDEAEDHEDFVYHMVLSSIVAEALGRLPEKDAQLIVAVDVDGQSTDEVAQSLGVTESTVESRLRRARQRLRTLLAD